MISNVYSSLLEDCLTLQGYLEVMNLLSHLLKEVSFTLLKGNPVDELLLHETTLAFNSNLI